MSTSAMSKPYFYSFNTKEKPGKIVCHCIRFQTLEIDATGFEETSFTLLGADFDTDPRVKEGLGCAHSFIQRNGLEGQDNG